MSLDTARSHDTPLTGTADLVAYFRQAEKPRAQHQVGLEHEKLLFLGGTRPPAPVPYEGERSVGALLAALGPSYAPFRDHPSWRARRGRWGSGWRRWATGPSAPPATRRGCPRRATR